MGLDGPPPDPPPDEGDAISIPPNEDDVIMSTPERNPSTHGEGIANRDAPDGNATPVKAGDAAPSRTQRGTLKELLDEAAARLAKDPTKKMSAEEAQSVFTKLYHAQPVPEKSNKKATCLPTLSEEENELFGSIVKECATIKKMTGLATQQFLIELIKVLHHSEWTTVRIFDDRLRRLQQPPPTKPNAWSQPLLRATHDPESREETFRFDKNRFSEQQRGKLVMLCEATHLIPIKIRKPTDDEWTIITGLLDGSIVAKKLPQFLKRCCNMELILQILDKIEKEVEGELHAGLPLDFKIHPHNQTTARLSGDMEATMRHRNWGDPAALEMLQNVKSIAYNPKGHSIHFHFYERSEAVKWNAVQIPYRNLTLRLKMPYDATSSAATAQERQETERNDPYQRFYRIRLHDVNRYTDVQTFLRYLEEHTSTPIKIAYPLDSYGTRSAWSLVWEIVFDNIRCPKELREVYRVQWDTTLFYLEHLTGRNTLPCLICGQPGHRARACTAHEDTIVKHTWVIDEESIRISNVKRDPWKTLEDAAKAFGRTPPSPTEIATEPTQPKRLEPTGSGEARPTTSCNDGRKEATLPSSSSQRTQPEQQRQQTAEGGGYLRRTQQARAPRPAGRSSETTPAPHHFESPHKGSGIGTSANSNGGKRGVALKNSFAVLADDNTDQHETAPRAARDDHQRQPMSSSDPQPAGPDPGPQEPVAPGDAVVSAARQSGRTSHTKRVIDLSLEQDDDIAMAEARLSDLKASIERCMDPYKFEGTKYMDPQTTRALRKGAQATTADHLIEALRLHRTETPANGNCQFHAIVEAILKRPIQTIPPNEAERLTAMVKTCIQAAAAIDEDKESEECAGRLGDAFLLEHHTDTDQDHRKMQLQTAQREYLRELADSPSALASWLPPRFWGATDTLRLAAKGLGRSIYLMMQTSTLGLYHFKPQILRRDGVRFRSAGIFPRTHREWLLHLAADVEKGAEPLILFFSANHYQGLIPTLPSDIGEGHKTRQLSIAEFLQQQTPAAPTSDGAALSARETGEDDDGDWRMIQDDVEPINLSQLADATTGELYDALHAPTLDHQQKLELAAILAAETTRRKELLSINASDIPSLPHDIAARIDKERRITLQIVEQIAHATTTSLAHAEWTARKYLDALTPDLSLPYDTQHEESDDAAPTTGRGRQRAMKRLRAGSDLNTSNRKRVAANHSSSEEDGNTALALPPWPGTKRAHMKAVRAWGRLRYMAATITEDETFPALGDTRDMKDYLLTYPGHVIALLRAHPSPLYLLSLVPRAVFRDWANILLAEQVHVQVHRLVQAPEFQTRELLWWADTFAGELTDRERYERATAQGYWAHLEALPQAPPQALQYLNPARAEVARALVVVGLLFPALFAALIGQTVELASDTEEVTEQHTEFERITAAHSQTPELQKAVQAIADNNDWQPLHSFLARVKIATLEPTAAN